MSIGSNGGNLFFQLVNACHEKCAIALTSDRSFGEWGEVFGDACLPPRGEHGPEGCPA
ncbi:ATP-binding protein [Paraburkholderia caledonica]|uniref:ATP-binding protein n=1 Tax=Paraburkholderia graminis TaxID=60548 RepID=UPI00244B4547|nr:ATP-binding protein [Paraburkholderia graminis]